MTIDSLLLMDFFLFSVMAAFEQSADFPETQTMRCMKRLPVAAAYTVFSEGNNVTVVLAGNEVHRGGDSNFCTIV